MFPVAPDRSITARGAPGDGRESCQREEIALDSAQKDLNNTNHQLNKYELIIVAAQEARRMNELSRQTGLDIGGKVANIALEETVKGNVLFRYGSERPEEAAPEPEPETQE